MIMNDDPSPDNNWLQSTLRKWADRPLGKMPINLYEQVTQRYAKPTPSPQYHRVVLSIAILLAIASMTGWWLTQSYLEDNRISETLPNKVLDSATLLEPKVPTPDSDQFTDQLRTLQQQTQLLQAQLSMIQLSADLRSMEQQYYEINTAIVRNQQKSTFALSKYQVICEWLKNQDSL